MRSWDRQPIFDESMNMELNCLMHHRLCILPGCSCCDTSRKIGGICWVIAPSFLDHNKEPVHLFHLSIWACLQMLWSVPGERSSPWWPAMVIRPDFSGCSYCLWLPFITTMYQQSYSIVLIISRTFRINPLLYEPVQSGTSLIGQANIVNIQYPKFRMNIRKVSRN